MPLDRALMVLREGFHVEGRMFRCVTLIRRYRAGATRQAAALHALRTLA